MRAPASTSPPMPLCAYTIAPSCTVRCPDDPTCPASSTLRSSTVLPASPVCAQMMLSSPTTQACPICTRLSILAPRLHARLADGGAVDRGEALHLDVVFDDGHAGLHDLEVRCRRRVWRSRSRRRRRRRRSAGHAIADAAELAHRGVRVRQEIVADLGAFVDHDMRMQDRVAADAHALADHGKRADRAVLADLGGGRDVGQRVDARRGPRRLVEERQCAREIEIRDSRRPGTRWAVPASGSVTRMAAALVCFTLGAYFGLARKVRCPGPACSMPATPVISSSPSPSRRQPSAAAISPSFIENSSVAERLWREADIRRVESGGVIVPPELYLAQRWTMYCPQCRAERGEGFTECPECHAALLPGSAPPAQHALDPALELVVVLESNDRVQIAMAQGLARRRRNSLLRAGPDHDADPGHRWVPSQMDPPRKCPATAKGKRGNCWNSCFSRFLRTMPRI